MADKRIVLRFIGGDRDGEVVDSAKDPTEAGQLIHLTNNGQMGIAFRGLSQRAVEAMQSGQPREELGGTGVFSYQVTQRTEKDDCVSVALVVIPEPPRPGKHDIRGELVMLADGQATGTLKPKGEPGAIPFHLTEVTGQFPMWAILTVGDGDDGFPLRLNPEFCIGNSILIPIVTAWDISARLLKGEVVNLTLGGIKCAAWAEDGVVFIDTADRREAILRYKK